VATKKHDITLGQMRLLGTFTRWDMEKAGFSYEEISRTLAVFHHFFTRTSKVSKRQGRPETVYTYKGDK